MITRKAYAKLNLTLDILGKREDGYHDLSMVMQSISLCDTLHVSLTEGTDILCRVDGADLPADESNLAVKAARAFWRETGIAPRGLSIELKKHIPMAAGMAGGSADAAAVLHALRETNVRAGFIHVPALPEQTQNRPETPSMPLDDMVRAIEAALNTL